MCVFVVEEEVRGRTIVEALGDFLVDVRTGVGTSGFSLRSAVVVSVGGSPVRFDAVAPSAYEDVIGIVEQDGGSGRGGIPTCDADDRTLRGRGRSGCRGHESGG